MYILMFFIYIESVLCVCIFISPSNYTNIINQLDFLSLFISSLDFMGTNTEGKRSKLQSPSRPVQEINPL